MFAEQKLNPSLKTQQAHSEIFSREQQPAEIDRSKLQYQKKN